MTGHDDVITCSTSGPACTPRGSWQKHLRGDQDQGQPQDQKGRF
jgi:hypothetical protein